jgi:hypothetical protein
VITQEQIEDYFIRSKDEVIVRENLIENEHGFCSWRVTRNKLVLINVYGDGDYWDEWATKKAKELGAESIVIATRRNPKPFIRKYKCKQIATVLERKVE